MEKQLSMWKNNYGKIYKIKTTLNEYIVKIPNVGDCEKLQRIEKTCDKITFKYAVLDHVLYPEKEKIYEADSDILATFILDSAFIFSEVKYKELLTISQSKINEDIFNMKVLVCANFNFISWNEINNMSIEDLFAFIRLVENNTKKEILTQENKESPEQEIPTKKMSGVQRENQRKRELEIEGLKQGESLKDKLKSIRGF